MSNPVGSKIRIAFLPFYVPYYEGSCSAFPVEKKAICERLAEMLRAYGEVIWDGKMIQDETEAASAGKAAAAAKPDCAVVFTSIAVFASIPRAALEAITCPLLLWNAQQIETVSGSYTMVEIVRNTGQIGIQALSNALMRERRPFRILAGFEGAAHTQRGLAGFFGAIRAVKTLRSARLLAVGDQFVSMLDIAADDNVLRTKLGIEVVRVGSVEWTKRYQTVPAAKVKQRAEEVTHAYPVSDIGDDEMSRSVRLAEALAGLVEEHRAIGGTVNCHGPNCMRNPAIGITACYSLGEQNTQGRPFTCTGDIPTAIAMLILEISDRRVSMYTEVQVMDEKREAIVDCQFGGGRAGDPARGRSLRPEGQYQFQRPPWTGAIPLPIRSPLGSATVVSASLPRLQWPDAVPTDCGRGGDTFRAFARTRGRWPVSSNSATCRSTTGIPAGCRPARFITPPPPWAIGAGSCGTSPNGSALNTWGSESVMTRTLTMAEAIHEAIRHEMRRESQPHAVGAGHRGLWGNFFGVYKGLFAEFGEDRVKGRPAVRGRHHRVRHRPGPGRHADDRRDRVHGHHNPRLRRPVQSGGENALLLRRAGQGAADRSHADRESPWTGRSALAKS